MKKYKNNITKYLLLGLCMPMVVSTLPAENVFAAESEVPTLNVYMNNGSPKLEWATTMLKENILNKTSFENGEELPKLKYGRNDEGQQSFTTETSFSGLTSLKIGKTTPNLGNSFNAPQVSAATSTASFLNRKYIPNGTNLSVSVKVKTDSEAIVKLVGNGGTPDRQITFNELFGDATEFKFVKDVSPGTNYFYVTNPEKLKKLIGKSAQYTVNTKSTTGDYLKLQITNIDETTGKVTLDGKFTGSFSAGEDVLAHRHYNPVTFNSRTVTDTNGEWVTINSNTFVDGGNNDFNTLLRGFEFRIVTQSEGTTYIDDVEFGYATEVEVFRDGSSIYRGYLSDFEDTTIKDNVKPNKITKVNTTINNDFNINFKPTKPNDPSNIVNYTIQAIAGSCGKITLTIKETF